MSDKSHNRNELLAYVYLHLCFVRFVLLMFVARTWSHDTRAPTIQLSDVVFRHATNSKTHNTTLMNCCMVRPCNNLSEPVSEHDTECSSWAGLLALEDCSSESPSDWTSGLTARDVTSICLCSLLTMTLSSNLMDLQGHSGKHIDALPRNRLL